tara:strand:- start:45 stop:257 length:213 start_codon:yes stop_codon:yes gene_type:complete
MACTDHETHLQNLVDQARKLSNEIETKRTTLLKVRGAIEYLTGIGVKLPEQAPVEAPSEPESEPESEVVT